MKFILIPLMFCSLFFLGCSNHELVVAIEKSDFSTASNILDNDNVETEVQVDPYRRTMLFSKKPTSRNLYLGTLIFKAISNQDYKMTKLLIEKGANVNAIAKSSDGRTITPLAMAISYKNNEIAMLLVENGSDINAKTTFNTGYPTPILITAIEKSPNIALELIKQGADLDAREMYSSKRPIHYAAGSNDNTVLKAIILKNNNVNINDRHLITPLHTAVIHRNLENIKLLVDNGANINATRLDNSFSPLDHSDIIKDRDIACYLVKKGAKFARNHYWVGKVKQNNIKFEVYADTQKKESDVIRITNNGTNSIRLNGMALKRSYKQNDNKMDATTNQVGIDLLIQPRSRVILTDTSAYADLIRGYLNGGCTIPSDFSLSLQYIVPGYKQPFHIDETISFKKSSRPF